MRVHSEIGAAIGIIFAGGCTFISDFITYGDIFDFSLLNSAATSYFDGLVVSVVE